MQSEKKDEKIGEALLKVALGYRVEEVTEEYAEVDGELKLTKRKETRKDIPPDLKAVQMLMTGENADYSVMSDEELEAEKARLLAQLSGNRGKGKMTETEEEIKEETKAEKKAVSRKKPRGEIRKRRKGEKGI